jgi:hypothetical protein
LRAGRASDVAPTSPAGTTAGDLSGRDERPPPPPDLRVREPGQPGETVS